MKLFDRTPTEPLDPEAERRLEAIDRALAGRPVEDELSEYATLAEEIRELRSEPSEQWRLEIDAKAGAGFGPSRLGRLRGLLPDRPVGRLLAPAGALATALVVVAVAVSQVGEDEGSVTATPEDPTVLEQATEDLGGGGQQPAIPSGTGPATSESSAGADPSTEDLYEARRSSGEQGALDLGAGAPVPPGDGRTAPGKSKRQQDRSAFLALKTDTEEVREVSDRAIQITESAGGVVLSSQLTEREAEATALLELSLPTRELDATLDRLTDLATVESLNEAAVDITRPFVSARDRLRDARAERRELLRALGNASTDEEAEALRRQLQQARREISRAESAFDNIARRARSSNVNLEVNGTPGGGDDGSWDLGEAADDALSVLKTVAGVLLVSAAIIAPIAILIAVTTWIVLVGRRRRRERALDD